MEPIEITVDGMSFTALPQADGSFDIYNFGELAYKIIPDGDVFMNVTWRSPDLVDPVLTQKIGAAITRADL